MFTRQKLSQPIRQHVNHLLGRKLRSIDKQKRGNVRNKQDRCRCMTTSIVTCVLCHCPTFFVLIAGTWFMVYVVRDVQYKIVCCVIQTIGVFTLTS
jgi:hypothetical protein